MSRIRKAAKATLVAQFFNWAGLLLSLATVPLYLHWLGQERYGILLTGLAFASYLLFSDGGISWASMLLIAESNGRHDRDGIAAIFRTSFPLAACSGLLVVFVVSVACLILRPGIAPIWLPNHVEFPGLLISIGASVVFTLGFSPFYNLLIGLQDAHLAALYQGCARLFGTLGSVAVASTGASLGVVYGANVGAALIAGIVMALHCHKRHPWAFARGHWCERSRIRQQMRTGAKSLVMQVGIVLWGTAPVLAISFAAGPQFVPFFSIPYTLLNAPLGFLASFSANLQAAYGEAMGRGEGSWVVSTVQKIFRQIILITSLLGVGFLLLGSPFISLWTAGRIEVPIAMISSVIAIAVTGSLLTTLRYALTGINRHREAAAADIIAGVLALVTGIIVVRTFGYVSIGASLVVVTLLTTGWTFPRELRIALNTTRVLPNLYFWGCWLGTTVVSFSAGWLSLTLVDSLPPAVQILITGTVISVFFLGLAHLLLRDDLRLRSISTPHAPS